MSNILSRPFKDAVALEMIDFQSDNFGINLEQKISEIADRITSGRDGVDDLYIDVENIIFKRLGIKILLITNSEIAAVLPFFPNKNHIFIDKYYRGNFNIEDQDKLLEVSNNKKGFVDIEKAKVGGLFSEYRSNVYINFKFLVKDLKINNAEITAILLHELGHIFYALEYSDRLESSNQILTSIAKDIISKKTNKDLTYIYKELKSINDNVTPEDIDKIINGNKIISGYHWFKNLIGVVETQLRNGKYDETSFEQMADNFVSRFGYGRSLITGLDKLHTMFEDPAKFKSLYLFYNITSTFQFAIGVLISTIAIVSGLYLLGVILSISLISILRFSGEDFKNYTYDDLKIRYKRVRQQLIEALKNLKLNEKDTKELIMQIEDIDKVMDNTYSNKYILEKIANVIFKKSKDAKTSIEEQQILEDLANNDLFLMASKFKTL